MLALKEGRLSALGTNCHVVTVDASPLLTMCDVSILQQTLQQNLPSVMRMEQYGDGTWSCMTGGNMDIAASRQAVLV